MLKVAFVNFGKNEQIYDEQKRFSPTYQTASDKEKVDNPYSSNMKDKR